MKTTAMVMMLATVALTMLFGTSLSSPINPRDLTRHQIRQLSDYVFTLEARKLELEDRAEKIRRQPNQVAIGRACLTDEDCPADSLCVDMLQVLALFLAESDALRHFDVIARKTRIDGRECWSDPTPALARVPADLLLERIVAAKREIGRVYEWFDERSIVLTRPAGLDSGNADEITAKTHDVRAAVRQGAGMDMNTMMLVLAMRGNDGTDSSLSKLLPILLMQNAGKGGAGGDLMNNPILMMTLLNNNKDSSSTSSDLLLMMSVMQAGNTAAGGASTNLMSSPLLLMTLLKPSSGTAKTSLSDMLPLLMMSGGMGAGGGDLMSNPLLLTTLLDSKSDSSLAKMLPLLMMGGMGGAGGDISSMLPMIVLLNKKSGTTTTSSDLLPLIMMMGQSGSGSGQQDISKMLPILLMNNKDMKTEDLLPIIMMMSGKGADMQSMLPLMMLIGGGNTKDTSTSSNLSKMLPLLMMMGGADKGGVQSMLPLMMATGSDLKTEDLMMMMMLGQGADSMQAMMPLLLLKSSSSSSMNSLLPLLVLGNGGKEGEGNGEGSLDVLPLLYKYPNHFSDMERSMLIMMGMADKLKSDSLTYDSETGLVVVDKNSPLNMILPMVMMKKDGDTSDQMMLMIFMLSLMEGRREIPVLG